MTSNKNKPIDHGHLIKGDGKGGVEINCDDPRGACKVAKWEERTVRRGATEDRSKTFKRAN